MNIKGYNIEIHYDRENWDETEYISAMKYYPDGSFDRITLRSDSLEEMAKRIEDRTDCDIISKHFRVLIRDARGDNLQALLAAEKIFGRDPKQALILVADYREADPAAKQWKRSLLKHLAKRVTEELINTTKETNPQSTFKEIHPYVLHRSKHS